MRRDDEGSVLCSVTNVPSSVRDALQKLGVESVALSSLTFLLQTLPPRTVTKLADRQLSSRCTQHHVLSYEHTAAAAAGGMHPLWCRWAILGSCSRATSTRSSCP